MRYTGWVALGMTFLPKTNRALAAFLGVTSVPYLSHVVSYHRWLYYVVAFCSQYYLRKFLKDFLFLKPCCFELTVEMSGDTLCCIANSFTT